MSSHPVLLLSFQNICGAGAKIMRRITAAAAILAAIGGLSLASAANASIQHFNLHIPRESLDGALRDLAQQTGFQVAHFSDQVKTDELVGPLQGAYSPSEALRALLKATGLSYRALNNRAFIVATPAALASTVADPSGTPSPTSAAVESQKEGKTPSSAGFQMAQVDQGAAMGAAAVDRESQGARAEGQLQEVIVTAQKREQRSFDVPISLAVVGSQELQRENITGLDNLQFAVPGMTISQAGAGVRRIEIRGISNAFGNGASVGEYIDEADATSQGAEGGAAGYGTLDLGTYDLNRVEVLRGPQGTLYGEGSIGGTIRFIANQPVLDAFQMDADISALFTQDGAPSQRIVAVLNTPLLSNTLGLRFAGQFDHEGGWIDQPAANVKNFNGQNLAEARVSGLWKPTERLTVNVLQIIHRNAFGLSNGEDASGNFTQDFHLTTTPNAENSTNLSNVTVTYDLPQVRVLSTTTYFTNQVDLFNYGYFEPLPHSVDPSGPTEEIYAPSLPVSMENVSQELRVMSTQSGPLQWTAGAFYKHYTEGYSWPEGYYAGLSPPAVLPAPYLGLYGKDGSKSWSAYGDASYKILDRLTVGAGIRYFKDDESSDIDAVKQTGTFTSPDPRVYVQYHLTGNANAYASATKGFRSGGFNGFHQPKYNPEEVWTYELGTKLRLLNNSLSIDTDVFLSDYTDYVVNGLIDVNGVFANDYSNSGVARIKGIESNVAWRLGDQWSLGVDGDYMNGRFVHVASLDSAFDVGDPVPLVPRYTVAAFAERDFVWDSKRGFARLDYTQRASESYWNRANGPRFFGSSPAIYMLGFNLGIQWNQSLRLGVFSQNLLNEHAYLDPIQYAGLSARPQPRTIGIDFGVDFE